MRIVLIGSVQGRSELKKYESAKIKTFKMSVITS